MRLRTVIGVLGLLAVAGVATAADQVVIEDWKAYPVGTTGVPGDWKPQNWGTPHYENLKIVEDEGRRALYMKSVNDSSTINKEIKGKVRLKDTPMLEWQWKSIAPARETSSAPTAFVIATPAIKNTKGSRRGIWIS